jgi:hypothetical protein
MNRAIEARIAKLEAKAPEPQSPSQFDGMTCDELTVFILEQYAELLACDDTPEEIRADAKREGARISWEITETVNFASGRWAMPPVFQNYQERIASSKARWKRLQPSRGEYVPALNNKIESDGFDRPEPVTPDLMARRAKLWAHSIVNQIVKEAPSARIPERSLFHECQSFKRGQPGKPSDDCGQQCRRQCLNARRGGFRSNGRIVQTTH